MIHPGGSTFLAILGRSPGSNRVYHLKKEQGKRALSPLPGVRRRHHKAPRPGLSGWREARPFVVIRTHSALVRIQLFSCMQTRRTREARPTAHGQAKGDVPTAPSTPASPRARRRHSQSDTTSKGGVAAKAHQSTDTRSAHTPSMHTTLLAELKLQDGESDQLPTRAVRGRRKRP